MIVWGGYDDDFILNSGGRYNPATGAWTATSTVNAPEPRYYHNAFWTGTEMIVWGGQDENENRANNGGRYNPATDTWTALATSGAPSARYLSFRGVERHGDDRMGWV